MWKKDDAPARNPTGEMENTPKVDRTSSPVSSSERATIGRSIAIRGDVTGDEDLMIQGRVDGSVDLQQHAVTIGPDGEVKASVVGRIVTVEGRVEGNISAEEQVILRSSALVEGDITAPRVVLEDGARFRGGIDMGDVTDRGGRAGGAKAAAGKGGGARGNSEPVPALTGAGESAGGKPAASTPAEGAVPARG